MNCLRNEYPIGAKSISPSLFGKPTKRSVRAAVKQAVLAVQARFSLSDEELAEVIGASKETVANWRDEAATMNTEALLIFAYCFGEESIEPVRQLYLCAPVEQPTIADRLERIEAEARAIRRDLA